MTSMDAPATQTRAKRKFSSCSCFLLALTLLALAYLFLRGMGAFLITGDPLKKADAVVALGGGDAGRVIEAANLIGEQKASWLILTEPGEVKSGQGMGSEYFRMEAIDHGLSPYVILVSDTISLSTHDEAQAVLKILNQHQFQSVIVVTEPYHTQRARMIFREVFRGSGKTVRVHPVPDHWYRSGTWFLSFNGWQMTMNEYVKMAGFVLGVYKTLD